MDGADKAWHFADMTRLRPTADGIPAWNLYGEAGAFPDVLHIERITDRAAGLDWVIAPHRHPHLHQFFMIRSGEADIQADGHRLRPAAPFLLSVPPGVIHGFTFSAGTDGDVLTVPLQSLPDVLDAGSPLAATLGQVAVLEPGAEITGWYARIHAEHAASLPGRAVLLRSLATEVACAVLRALPRRDGSAAADPRLARFQELLRTHLRDGWRVADYARAVGVSERHLGRLCLAATGHPTAVLVETAVMREACRLLVYTRSPVASVGYQLGFDDPSYFSRSFRRAIGVAPGVYRAGFEKDGAGLFTTEAAPRHPARDAASPAGT